MTALLANLEKYGALYLAGAAGTFSALTTAGVLPEAHLKYYVAIGAVLGVWKGVLEQIQRRANTP